MPTQLNLCSAFESHAWVYACWSQNEANCMAIIQSHVFFCQVLVTADDKAEALSQVQDALSAAWPSAIPPILDPLVVVGPFGSGKRAVLRDLLQRLPGVVGFPHVVTTKQRSEGAPPGS